LQNSDRPDEHAPDIDALRKLGVYSQQSLREYRLTHRDENFLIPNLVRHRSRNLVIGDSGIGKTPFTVSMAIHIAAGLPWLNHKAGQPARALYLDGESGHGDFDVMTETLSRHAGLPGVPANLMFFNPMWPGTPPITGSIADRIAAIIELYRPAITFVDPLRIFFPKGDGDNNNALMEETNRLTRHASTTWMIMHHLRKKHHEGRVSLEDDTYAWFQEASGLLALINHADLRLGIEPSRKGEADLLVAGFLRGLGKVGPLHVVREFDDGGDPQGYRLLSGIEHLSESYRKAYETLPDLFRFKAVKEALGNTSSSNTAALIQQCLSLCLINRLDNGWYKKVEAAEPGN
jgi:hypothetical protein